MRPKPSTHKVNRYPLAIRSYLSRLLSTRNKHQNVIARCYSENCVNYYKDTFASEPLLSVAIQKTAMKTIPDVFITSICDELADFRSDIESTINDWYFISSNC